MNQIVIDANNAILGRLASYAAKQALLGKKVVIVNCVNAVLTGRRLMIIEEYKRMVAMGGTAMRGPIYDRVAFKIVKRTVRGMLASQQKRGKDALGRVMCYNDVPKEYESAKKLLAGKEKKVKTVKLSDVIREL